MLVVFEGPDGVGKTTMAQVLVDRLAGRGVPVVYAAEPWRDCGPARRALDHLSRGCGCLYHLAGFLSCMEEHWYGRGGLAAAMTLGMVVVSDRYYYSTAAYQSSEEGCPLGWADIFYEASRLLPAPHIVFYVEPRGAWEAPGCLRGSERRVEEAFRSALSSRITEMEWLGEASRHGFDLSRFYPGGPYPLAVHRVSTGDHSYVYEVVSGWLARLRG